VSTEVDASNTGASVWPPGVEDLHEVRRGGFSSVYRGWQPAFGRWVAIKVLHGVAGTGGTDRFASEARALGALSEHPHVVTVYDAGEIDGHPYLVMPFLTGGSLQDRMRTGGLSPREVAATGWAVADALAEAHRRGILHRDIKPANILFTAYGDPHLADFGVARFTDSTMTGGLLAATVAYAAPEVLSGQPATAAADVYSLGATLYAALRGVPPFPARDGEPAVAQAVRVVRDQPDPLAASGVPPALGRVVARAMAKDPAQRYPSASALRDALAAIPVAELGAAHQAEGDRGPGRVAPPPAPPLRAASAPLARARRRPRRSVVYGAVAAAVLAAGGTALATNLSGGSHPRPAAATAPTTTRPAPTTPQATTTVPAPTTTAGSATTTVPANADKPPSASGLTSASEADPTTLADELTAYYSLVDRHRLDVSWGWLSPAFQDRIGHEYYQQFWDTIASVQVLAVRAGDGSADITLRYTADNGNSSVESARLGFTIAGGRILIDTDRATAD
jgi:hypothetical protein